MRGMDGMSLWTAASLASTLAMWVGMMAAMMLPSALPMLRVVGAASRNAAARGEESSPPAMTALGYLAAWFAFSVVATVVQTALRQRAMLSPDLALVDARVGAGLVVAAGLYQFTPLKGACLSRCRSPFTLMLDGWRNGYSGALRMGVEQGLYCVACCWALMLVLFVAGVMNPMWVLLLAAAIAAEKLAPGDRWPRRTLGVALLASGAVMAWSAV